MSKARGLADLGNAYSDGALSNRNLIINGAMQVAQRGVSAAGIGASNSNYFTADRWGIICDTAGRVTMSQTADGPNGIANCIKLDCTTAETSIPAPALFMLRQSFEGQDLQGLCKGTADAKPLTVSFYVKASGTFTFACELFDDDNARHVSQSFTTTTSWERVELVFPADVIGALDDDNAGSMTLDFWVHAGSIFNSGALQTSWGAYSGAGRAAGIDSLLSSVANELFITGVQLEVGDTATPFEHRSYSDQLQRCQRYFWKYPDSGDYAHPLNLSSGYRSQFVTFPVIMRVAPTVSNVTGSGSYSPANPDITGGRVHGAYFQWNSVTSSNFARVDSGFTADAEL